GAEKSVRAHTRLSLLRVHCRPRPARGAEHVSGRAGPTRGSGTTRRGEARIRGAVAPAECQNNARARGRGARTATVAQASATVPSPAMRRNEQRLAAQVSCARASEPIAPKMALGLLLRSPRGYHEAHKAREAMEAKEEGAHAERHAHPVPSGHR